MKPLFNVWHIMVVILVLFLTPILVTIVVEDGKTVYEDQDSKCVKHTLQLRPMIECSRPTGEVYCKYYIEHAYRDCESNQQEGSGGEP